MRPLPRLALPLLFLASPAFADDKPAPAADRVKKDLDFLAGKECEGRGLKTKGILKAGEYIAEQFKAAGLKPGVGDSYFQPFDVPGPKALGTPLAFTLKNGDKTYEPKANAGFIATSSSASGKATGEVVFVGFGITSKEQPKYDDYAGVDVKGKFVVVLRRTPQADDEKGAFGKNSPHAALVSKVQNAIDHKAAGVLLVSDTALAGTDDPPIDPEQIRNPADDLVEMPAGPVLHVKRDVIEALLKGKGTTLAEWEKKANKAAAPDSFPLAGWTAETELTFTQTVYPTRNVVGVLDGAGPLKDQTVVVGGHYDHLGYGEKGTRARADDEKALIHFGADDNASGTTGVLELARRFGAMKERQGRRIVFVAFSGEEQGLFGSKHYAANPPFPLKDTAFMLNMDMIGRMTQLDDKNAEGKPVKKDRLVVYGTGTSTGLDKLVDDTLAKGDYKLMKIPGGTGPSDHTSFYRKGVPVLFFFTGTHKDYHLPTDTPDKINVPGLLKVVDGVGALADHFAAVKDKPNHLKTDGGSEDPTDPNQVSFTGPRLGFMPDNYGEVGKGALVGPVRKDGPADKGGVKEGDYITAIQGVKVTSIVGYTQQLNKLTPGVEIEITVLRGDKELKLKVTPIAK